MVNLERLYARSLNAITTLTSRLSTTRRRPRNYDDYFYLYDFEKCPNYTLLTLGRRCR